MKWFKAEVAVFLALLLATVGWLWYRLNLTQEELTALKNQEQTAETIQAAAADIFPDGQIESLNIEVLEVMLASLSARLEVLEAGGGQSGQGGPAPAPATTTTVSFQPQVIYLGAASTQNRDWTETGQAVTINSGDYPADVSATFEAGLSIVGGEAWARLKNKTTGAVLSVTEVMHNNSSTTWKTSPAFKLHSGYNNYVVELKSSSGETVNLAGARIRISR
ncbi:MAG: hypothetical protein UX85_C0010G0024 [Candidatus Beckwithbacteria bacterium GW2011_GWB1_47_15]|uniref:Uncharacterized protein n=1 Tax=Candidatus Beckwithbacteria bacterium GW2011_GWB1_47_15 TaxID=1618371 RepID=A0A0G1RTS3_9BACT|nr:MAG: hypothetical protein UY43_C0001G0828 [Candidatus Beckwithbacteria bacterium GW2011_GWC1_49_16]AQS30935.1 hypothetical protein [uncultured bacterium]KKU34897.1 MAG: hypothetical protein UX50_C0009G0024 [Candidatus Beckwithbacteria bacterium GW2011_GWA1_46_30]KKU60491.1 MAG: hypothetical protein UX85_C0010G0024 [Candidatus Beckwithbacteria bacterium GW2011_GWB1_47_15]KKU72366.1 MAG: hypothetical protein UX97_C0001G0236 [Candidatus Beckwithbacteria bacterium GW2011_GWA2_47_25]OGD48258.1 M